MYTENLLNYAQNPPNYGDIKDADVVLDAENASCGDNLRIFIKLDKNIITSASFEGNGCAISKASTSMTLEDIVGKDLETILQVSEDDIDKKLGLKVSGARQKCAYLILNAFSTLKK